MILLVYSQELQDTVKMSDAYRNPFNKGVMLHHIGADGLVAESFWMVRERDGNPGREGSQRLAEVAPLRQIRGSDQKVTDGALAARPQRCGWRATVGGRGGR